MLKDSFGRIHHDLRISVTDRCNIRCFYCMPNENVRFKPRHELLTFEEIARFARVAASLGVSKIRLTGGEPLVRKGLPNLVRELRAIEGITDIALTTNGILLKEQAASLAAAGLDRLNISLDAMSPESFKAIARRDGLEDVLAGIRAAQEVGFKKIKLNAVAIAGISEREIVPLCTFARSSSLELRFIEFMPLDAEQKWAGDSVLSGAKVREIIEASFGGLRPVARLDSSQPAVDWEYLDGGGIVGFINPVTEPFCASCDRLRITAEGQIRNCLFSIEEWDARKLLRDGATDEDIADLIQRAVAAKKAGHGIDQDSFQRPERAMYQIGG